MLHREALYEFGAMTGCFHLMPRQREMRPDWTGSGEERLRATRIAKADHLPLTSARRLVAILGTVVRARGRFNEHMLYPSEFRNVRLCCPIAAQLIGNAELMPKLFRIF